MSATFMHQLAELLLARTAEKKVTWKSVRESTSSPSSHGLFTVLEGLEIFISAPISDQRDGDFCWLEVRENGKLVDKANCGATLWNLLVIRHKHEPLERLINYLGSL